MEMERRGLDALVITTPENILYLTGYQTPGYYMYQCLLVMSTQDPVLLIRNGEVSNARAYSWLSECIGYFDYEDPADTTAALLVAAGLMNGIGCGRGFLLLGFTRTCASGSSTPSGWTPPAQSRRAASGSPRRRSSTSEAQRERQRPGCVARSQRHA